MRISDWSCSDVCSSDLPDLLAQRHFRVAGGNEDLRRHHVRSAICGVATIGSDRRPEGSRRWVSSRMSRASGAATAAPPPPCSTKIGRASWRASVYQYVYIQV